MQKTDFKIRPVVGYEDSHLVSSDGRVFSKTRYVKSIRNGKPWQRINKGRWMKAGVVRYSQIDLARRKPHQVHRLVAQAFLPNPDNLPEVNHKNGVKTDNNVDNLEWVTRHENAQHARATGLNINPKGENCRAAKLKDSEVKQIREIYARSGYSQSFIAKMFNVHQGTISKIIGGKSR